MRISTLVFVVGVAFIFSVLCANIVFVSKCSSSSISKLVQSFSVALVETADEASASAVDATNRFARGTLLVTPAANDSSGQMRLDVYGNEVGNKLVFEWGSERAHGSSTTLTTTVAVSNQ